MEPGKVVASGWYAANVGDPFAAVENTIAGGPMRRAAARLGPLRGALIFAAARRGRGAALLRLEPGLLSVLALAALSGGPPIVVLELIPHRPPRTRAKRALASLWFRLVERPIYRRGMRAGQALSISEAESLARRYGLEPDRFPVVGWALCRTGLARTPPANARSGVLASGRAACDWETLLAAARPEWDLTVVCSERDADRVRSLGRGRARVLVEISRAEHDRLVSAAAVFAMPLVDDGLSAGQVRLMTATELGTAVVATRVATLAGYTREGATAVLVDPGDPDALRRAVDSLLADPDRRARLARAALDRARARTYAEYFADVRAMVLAAIGDQPRPEGTSSRSE
jgi:hypothetical protein